ncbi:uncharacterized protein [Palaemon carinicauda]|uniref:uncharacterized protein n=1 Tax=Palaemon carinicauda TaxID=392227 RepID=UPI0035B67381
MEVSEAENYRSNKPNLKSLRAEKLCPICVWQINSGHSVWLLNVTNYLAHIKGKLKPKLVNNFHGSIRKKRMATHSSLGIRGTFLTTFLVYTTSATYWHEHPQIDAVHAHNCDNDTYLVKGERVELDLGGKGFSSRLEVALTFERGERGDRCRNLITPGIRPNVISQALGTLYLHPAHTNKIHVVGNRTVWFCIRETYLVSDRRKVSDGGLRRALVEESEWMHQGANTKLEMVRNFRRIKCSLR